jgi:hypothetical protein
MSFEYTIEIKPAMRLDEIISKIENLSAIKGFLHFRENGILYIKDPAISSSWRYDIFFLKKETKIEVSLNGWSKGLHDLLKCALDALQYVILDDDGEPISLKKLFRIE